MFLLRTHLPCSLRASSRDVYLAEQGVAPAGVGTFPTSQGAMPSSVPDEGAAFSGRCDRGEGRRKCRLEHGRICPIPIRSTLRGGIAKKIATVERREASGPDRKGPRRLSQRRQTTCAVSALRSLTVVRGRKTERRWPRACLEGADDARLHECWRDALLERGLFDM